MKYLCLVYADEKKVESLPKVELDSLVADAIGYDKELRRSGHYVASAALEPVGKARTLRLRGGKLLITDGPFAETKEQLAGFLLIEADDMDEALRVAAKIPPARYGCIEVRPTQDLEDY